MLVHDSDLAPASGQASQQGPLTDESSGNRERDVARGLGKSRRTSGESTQFPPPEMAGHAESGSRAGSRNVMQINRL